MPTCCCEVVDAADPNFVGQQEAVQSVLDELGVGDKPRIMVFNKIDLLDADLRAAADAGRRRHRVRERGHRRGPGRGCSSRSARPCAADGSASTPSSRMRAASWWLAPAVPARRRGLHRCGHPPFRPPAGAIAAEVRTCRGGHQRNDPEPPALSPPPSVSADAIREAVAGIPAVFRNSPQFVSEALSASLGRPVVVKAESVNPIGCFKGRGTWLAVSRLVASAGWGSRNVAWSSPRPATSVRASPTPLAPAACRSSCSRSRRANAAKVTPCAVLGAEVRLVGDDFDAAREEAATYAADAAGSCWSTGRIRGSRSAPAPWRWS